MEHLDERAYSYAVPTGIAMYNARGAFYPAALQRMAVGVIEAHLEQIGWDAPKLVREYGLSWVLLSFSAEIRKPLSPDGFTARKHGIRIPRGLFNAANSALSIKTARLPSLARPFLRSSTSKNTVSASTERSLRSSKRSSVKRFWKRNTAIG